MDKFNTIQGIKKELKQEYPYVKSFKMELYEESDFSEIYINGYNSKGEYLDSITYATGDTDSEIDEIRQIYKNSKMKKVQN